MRRVFHESGDNVITRKHFKLRNILLLGLIPLFLICFTFGLLTTSAYNVFADDITDEFSNFLQYSKQLTSLNGLAGYYITGFTHQNDGDNFGQSESKPAVIPAQHDGYPILGIADSVFSGHTEFKYIDFELLDGTGSPDEISAYNRLPAELKTLGTAISTIGVSCFQNCTALVSVRFPASITELADNCFYGDTSLETIKSYGIDKHKYDSMQGLQYLKRIGAKCFRIGGKGVFDDVLLPDYPDGDLAPYPGKTTYYPRGTGLKTIGDTAFYVVPSGNVGAKMDQNGTVDGVALNGMLTLPESCTDIIEEPFWNMSFSVYLKGGPGTYECYPFGLALSRMYWNTSHADYGTTTINGVTFNFNTKTGVIGVPVTSSGVGSTSGTGKNFLIPNSVEVTASGGKGGTYSIANSKLKGIGPGMFATTSVTGIAFHKEWSDSGMTTLPTMFAESCSSLKEVLNVPDTIESVGTMCFRENHSLTCMTTTSTTTVAGAGDAYGNYTRKSNISFENGWNGTTNATTLVFPLACTSIGYWAFQNCGGITQLIIPANATADQFLISQAAFFSNNVSYPCKITAIYFPQFNDKSGTSLPNGILNVPGRPEEASSWYAESFPFGVTTLQHLYYGASNIDMGSGTFTDSPWTYQLNSDGTLTIIGASYDNLGDWNSNGNLTFPTQANIAGQLRAVTAIGNAYGINHNIFSSSHVFTKVTIPHGIKAIKYFAFAEQTIDQLDLGDTVESIEENAFTGTVRGTLKLPASLRSIAPKSFTGGRFDNKAIVFPGEIKEVSATAFQGTICSNLETVYYLQYQNQASDGVFDRQTGQYLRIDGDNAPSKAGSAGLKRSGDADPAVHYMDDYTPYIYEIGRTDGVNEDPGKYEGSVDDGYLAGFKAIVDHSGDYARPYADAVYAHPVEQWNEDKTSIMGYTANVRFGVRMLLQTEKVCKVQLVASPTTTVDPDGEKGGVTGLGTLYQPTESSIPAEQFFNVILSGANAQGTFIFRIFYENVPLTQALQENGFTYESNNRFVYHYTINVNMLASATFKHAVIENIGGADLPENTSTDVTGRSLVTTVKRTYDNATTSQYEAVIKSTEQVLGSGIMLPTELVFEHPNAEFIGWTTDSSIGSKIWTDYPDETETITIGRDESGSDITVTRNKFWLADGTNKDPFMVYLSDLDENVQVTFYSVFRLKINKAPAEPEWNWTYSEDPYPTGGGQKFLLPSSPVAAGDLSMFRIDESGNVSLVEPIMHFDDNGFMRAFDAAFSTSTHAGSYVVLNGDLTEAFNALGSTTSEAFNAWRLTLPNYTVSEFEVSKLALSIHAKKVTMTYGDYAYGNVEDGGTVEHYIATYLKTTDTDEVSYELGGRTFPGYPEGQTASDVFEVVVNGKTQDGDYPHVVDPTNNARNELTYTLNPKKIDNSSDYTFTGTTENIELEVTPRNISVNVSMQRQTNTMTDSPVWSQMQAQLEADNSGKQYYTWVYYGGAQKGGDTVGREAAVISLSENQPLGGGVIDADMRNADVLDYNYYFVQQNAPVSDGDGGYEAVGTSVYKVGNYYLGLYLTTKNGGDTYNNKDYAISNINNISALSSTFTGSARGYNFYIGPRVEITKAVIERPSIASTYYGYVTDANAQTNLYTWLNPGTTDAYKISVPENQDNFVAPALRKTDIVAANITLPGATKSYQTYWNAGNYSVGLKLPENFFANYCWEGGDTDTVQLAFEIQKAELKLSVSDTSSYYNETAFIGAGEDTVRGITGVVSIYEEHGLADLAEIFTSARAGDYFTGNYTLNGQTYRGNLIDAGTYVYRFALQGAGLTNFTIKNGENTDDGDANEWQISADGAYADINYTVNKAVMQVTLTGTGSLTEYYNGQDHVSDANQQAVFFNTNYKIANGTAGEEYYVLQYLYDDSGSMRNYGYRITFRAEEVEAGDGAVSVTAVGRYRMIISLFGATALNNVVFAELDGFTPNDENTQLISDNVIVIINPAEITVDLTTRAQKTRESDDASLSASEYLVYRKSEYANGDVWNFAVSEEHGAFLLNNSQYTVAYTVDAAPAEKLINAGVYSMVITIPAEYAGNYKVVGEGYEISQGAGGDTKITWNEAFTIYRAQITLQNLTSVSYDGERQDANIVLFNFSGTDVVPTEYTTDYTKDAIKDPITAGVYTVKLTLGEADRKNFVFVQGSNADAVVGGDYNHEISDLYEITPATVNPALDMVGSTVTYDGNAHQVPVEFTNALQEGGIIPEKMSPTADYEYALEYGYVGFAEDHQYKAVGTYAVTVTLVEGGNFAFGKNRDGYIYTYELTYSIVAKNIATATVAEGFIDGQDITYTGASLTPEILLSIRLTEGAPEVPLGPNEDYYIMHSADIEAFTNGRQTEVTVWIYGQGNYTGVKELHFKIVPAKVTVTADGNVAPQGTVTVTYNKNQQSITPTFTNQIEKDASVLPTFSPNPLYSGYTVTYENQDTSDTTKYTTTNTPVNAGTYDVTVTLKDQGNFTFEDGSLTRKFVFTITKAELRLTLSETFAQDGVYLNDFVYDGADWFVRLSGLALDNKGEGNNVVPANSEYSVKFYAGSVPSDRALVRILDAGSYCLVFAYTNEAIAKNYTVTEIVVNDGEREIALSQGAGGYTVDGNNTIIAFTVSPAEVIVNALSNKTYKGSEHTADITFTNQSGTEILPTHFTATYQKDGAGDATNGAEDAGTYTVTVTLTEKDATNFTIVAWEGDTKTRDFIIDPAQVTVRLEKNIEPYSGDVHTVQAIFGNASDTDVTPEAVDVDYRFAITCEGMENVPAYNALIDANTYSVVVNLLNDNYVFVGGEKASSPLSYTITAGTIVLSAEGERLKGGWERASYDPAQLITTTLTKEDFALVGSRQSDIDALSIAYISCRAESGGSYITQDDGSYQLTTRGTYYVTVQVTAPNHNTQIFDFTIRITGNDVFISVPAEFGEMLTAQYGSELSAESLKTQFLDWIANGKLSVINIPAADIGSTGQQVVDWLNEYGFNVSVSDAETSHSGRLKVGQYSLEVRLPKVDGGIKFSENGGYQNAISRTKFYSVTPLEIEIDWSILEGLVYSGYRQADTIKDGLKIANLIDGDQVMFGRTSLSVGTKESGFVANDVIDAVKDGDLIHYWLRVLTQNERGESTLEGDDRANYVFKADGQTEEHYFEREFTVARLKLQIVLAESSSTYGEAYADAFSFTYQSDLTIDAASLRMVVIPVLKLYRNDMPIEDEYPDVGSYTVKANTSTTDFGNYELDFVSESTHTINVRTVTLRLASPSGYYGEDIVLPSGENAWTVAPGSLNVLDKDLEAVRNAITLKTSATKGSVVNGEYSVTADLDSSQTQNYDISFVEGVYTINPRPIVIVIRDRGSVYGEPLDDQVNNAGSWSVSEEINTDAGSGTLNYGLYEADELQIVLTLNLTYSDYPTCNYFEGEIVPWASVISGVCNNPNYQVQAWQGGNYMVSPRTVSIQIGDLSAIYGEAYTRLGAGLTLSAPTVSADGKRLEAPGDWTYAQLDESHFSILPVDLSYLTFYLGKKATISDSTYAYVGKYPIVGAWAYGFEGRTVDYCYEITFSGAWENSLNTEQSFADAEDNGAGVYTIGNASITQDGNWTLNKLFYETSSGDKTEENGWFKMILEELLFTLKGDFTEPLHTLSWSSFTYESGTSAEGTVTFVATMSVNGKEEKIRISYTKPTYYRGIGTPAEDEPYFNEEDHLWYIHTGGSWRTNVTISVANHDDKTIVLTYLISECIATVTLNQAVDKLTAEYGEYEYLALDPGKDNYDEDDIKGLSLSAAINAYIFNNRATIITVDGFETAFPESTYAENIQRIIDNCWIEVVDARISGSGHLAAGYYTLRLVAREGCGFTAMFKASSSLLPPGEVDQGASNRLYIAPIQVDIDWLDPESAHAEEHIVESADRITYTYSGYDYSQQPQFTGIIAGDVVAAPTFRYLTEDGSVVDTVHNVRTDGYYTISIARNVLEGRSDDSVNYYLSADKSIRLDVVPRSISVEIDDLESTVYGVEPDTDRVFTQDDWHVSESGAFGLAHGETADDLNVSLFIDLPSRDAGFYEHAVDGRWDNENYSIHFFGGNYTITPKEIEVTISDLESYYGDDLAPLTFAVDERTLAYGELASDLLITLSKAEGTDVGEYAITGNSLNTNYEITFTDGVYTILRATNVWLREFTAFEFPEGQEPPEEQLPLSRFGEVHIFYFYDEACTELILDDVETLVDGTYYVRAFVSGTKNYTSLDNLYTITITPSFAVFNGGVDIGLYVVIWSVQIVALLGGVLFIRRRKHKSGSKKS